MTGRPYNVGLDSANLSKEELAQKIRRHVRDLTILVAELGRDPDQRNYIVSINDCAMPDSCPAVARRRHF